MSTRPAPTISALASLLLAIGCFVEVSRPGASALALGSVSTTAPPAAGAADAGTRIVLAQAGTEPGELEPRYQPVDPGPTDGYDSSYIFAITRALTNSTIVPAAKAPLFLLTVPLDLALLPIQFIGGFFG